MALQKQPVQIPLGVGMDSKSDPKQVKVGKLSLLENGVFSKIMRVDPRYGLTAYGSSILGGSTSVSSALALHTFQDELNLIDSGAFYTHTVAKNAWVRKASVTGASATSTSVVRNTYEQTVPDMAYAQGITVYAWEDSSGGVRASVYDQSNNQPILANTLISTTGIRPKCAATTDNIYIFWAETATTEIKSIRLNLADPTAFQTEVQVASNAHGTNPYLDVTQFDTVLVLAYRTGTPSLKVGYIRADGKFAGAVDGYPVPVVLSADATNSLAVKTYVQNSLANDGIYLFYHNGTDGLSCAIYNPDLANTPSPTVVDSSLTVCRNIGVVSISESQMQCWYEFNATNTYDRFIKTNTITRAGVVGTAAVFLRSVGLHSKPFFYGATVYMVISHENTVQSTYFTVSSSGGVANRISYQLGGGNSAKTSSLANVQALSETKFICPTLVKGPLQSESGTLFTIRGVQATQIDFDLTQLFQAVELGRSSLLSAGMMLNYDGINLNELGFNLYPEGVSASVDNSSGNLVAGTRQVVAVYEWTDQQGQIHRSAPSLALSATTTGGTSKVTYTIPTLRLTGKSNVSIVLYRTKASGTTFYRVNSVASPLLNVTTSDSVTYLDNIADSVLGSNQLLYTTGGVVDNIAPPSATSIVVYNNRAFLMGLEESNEVWFSKTFTLGEGVAFNDSFVLRVDQGKPGVVGGGVIDDKLILFKETSTHVTAGMGPLDTGFGSDLQTPQLISTDVGCTDPKSIVRFPSGLLFKSNKGWYQLDRSLQSSYVGAEVEAFNSFTVSSAVLVEDSNQIRITHTDGSAVVYDYLVGQWSTFTNYLAVSAVNSNGTYVLARSTGEVSYEDKTSYLDNASPYRLKLVTPWIQAAGIQGFQRVYEALFLGDRFSDHVFKVRIGYDFEDDFRDQFTIDTSVAMGSSYFGQGSYYGADTPYGGVSSPVEQFKVKPSVQKCQAIRFEIEGVNANAANGAGFSLSSLLLIIGVKAGSFKLANTKVMTPGA